MSRRYPGSIISASRNITPGSSSGIWTVPQQRAELDSGRWQGSERIDRSVRFNSADNAHFTWTPGTVGNRRTFTWSGWIKLGTLVTGSDRFIWTSALADPFLYVALQWKMFNGQSYLQLEAEGVSVFTTALFRDPSAWYHVVNVWDTTQASAIERQKIYVNGVQQTMTGTFVNQNFDLPINTSSFSMRIGELAFIGRHFDGYMAEINFIDGEALTPESFGVYDFNTGVWRPRRYIGTYGVNGFYLPFNNNATAAHLGLNQANLDSGDLYWPYTVLNLKAVGAGGSQNNTFIDSSTNNFAITRNGNTTQGTFSPFSADEGNWSADFFQAQSSNGITLGTTFGNAISSASSTFTVEAWIFVTSYPSSGERYYNSAIFAVGSTYMNFGVHSDGTLHFYHYDGVPRTVSSPSAITKNQWTHVAAATTGNTTKLFINGIQVASGTYYGHTSPNQQSCIGSTPDGNGSTNRQFRGNISNFRFSNSARYTTNFPVPTSPFTNDANTVVLTLQSNSFIDKSSSPYTLTIASTTVQLIPFSPFAPSAEYDSGVNGGSGYFDGTGDHLTVPDNAVWDLGSNNFTIESWVYQTTQNGYDAIVSQFRENTSTGSSWTFETVGSTLSFYWVKSGVFYNANGPSALKLNCWNHIAAVRNGNAITVYINGIGGTPVTENGSIDTSATNLMIGALHNTAGTAASDSSYWDGYISNLRIINGTAVYTANFTPPTAPVTAITNTQLLCNFTNAAITDSTGRNTVETVGNAQVNTSTVKYNTGSMVFDGTGDYLLLPSTDLLAFGTGDYTIELWVRHVTVSGQQTYVGDTPGNSNGPYFYKTGSNNIGLYYNSQILTGTTTVAINTWYHVAVSRSSGTVRLFVDGIQEASAADTTNLNIPIRYVGGDTFDVNLNGYIEDLRITKGVARYTGAFVAPERSFARTTRDIAHSQWHPVNLSVNNGSVINYLATTVTGSTGLNGVNNLFDGSLSTGATVTHSADNFILFTPTTGISYSASVEVYVYAANGYSITNYYSLNGGAEVSFTGGAAGFNGQAFITVATGSGTLNSLRIRLIRPGSASGVLWSAIRVDGTIITNIYGADNDSVVDSPTQFGADTGVGGEVRGNYATLNPLSGNQYGGGLIPTLTNGNLDAAFTGSLSNNTNSTLSLESGKWYCEFTVNALLPGANFMWFGAQDVVGFTGNGAGYNSSGVVICNGVTQGTYSTFTVGDVIGCAFDITNNEVSFYKNNVQQGTTGTLGVTTKTYAVWNQQGNTGDSCTANFGQRAFAYTAPAGFAALCTTNLPRPTIGTGPTQQPNNYFDVVTYTGNGTSPRTVGGLNFQPDLVWTKPRGGENYFIYDSVRGFGTTSLWGLASDLTAVEFGTTGSNGSATAFTNSGITFTAGASSNNNRNANGSTYVYWAWRAGGAAVTNTAGAITSQVSANTDSGFSIVTWTGNGANNATIGHGLGATPAFIIAKARNTTYNWDIYHQSLGIGATLIFTSATTRNVNAFGTSSPTSNVFYTYNDFTNTSGINYVAYCWTEIPGYSKIGSYIGNGSADGAFVYTGFRPRWILYKAAAGTAYNWGIYDTARDRSNGAVQNLAPNAADADTNYGVFMDILSNGFKCRASGNLNENGSTYIYMAFAETPFNYAGSR